MFFVEISIHHWHVLVGKQALGTLQLRYKRVLASRKQGSQWPKCTLYTANVPD